MGFRMKKSGTRVTSPTGWDKGVDLGLYDEKYNGLSQAQPVGIRVSTRVLAPAVG